MKENYKGRQKPLCGSGRRIGKEIGHHDVVLPLKIPLLLVGLPPLMLHPTPTER